MLCISCLSQLVATMTYKEMEVLEVLRQTNEFSPLEVKEIYNILKEQEISDTIKVKKEREHFETKAAEWNKNHGTPYPYKFRPSVDVFAVSLSSVYGILDTLQHMTFIDSHTGKKNFRYYITENGLAAVNYIINSFAAE